MTWHRASNSVLIFLSCMVSTSLGKSLPEKEVVVGRICDGSIYGTRDGRKGKGGLGMIWHEGKGIGCDESASYRRDNPIML